MSVEVEFVAWGVCKNHAPSNERTIVVINATIGRTEPTRLRLRGVPVGAKRGMWWALDATTIELPLMRDGNDTTVVLPPIDGWSGGWLGFER